LDTAWIASGGMFKAVLPKEFEKQPLVAVCGRFAKCSFVAEPHGDLGKARGRSRGLDSELKANAIIGLNAERYDMRPS
jgi:hypothetical protein